LSAPDVVAWMQGLPFRYKLAALAAAMVVVEVGFRLLAPKSRAYARWTGFFQSIGKVWTAVLLAIVYVLSIGPIGLAMRLRGQDPLDRGLAAEPSFWRPHEPSPLGPEQAARHQF
jgi:hypothetical protein